jgi:ACS family hexuronate transporter-like MFS transporter
MQRASSRLIPYRWIVCALLFFATTIKYTDRQILSFIKPILDGQLRWTNAEFGMVNSAFQGAYAISLLAPRFSPLEFSTDQIVAAAGSNSL